MKKLLKNKKIILLMAIIMMISVFIPACGRGSSTTTLSDNKVQVATYPLPTHPLNDADPSATFDNGIRVLHNIYETLLRYDPDKDIFIPILATDYSKSEDNLTWTFHIRQNVKFHDGTILDAEAVKFSIDRTKKLAKGAAFIWDPVEEINVIDKYTVEFKLNKPAAVDFIVASANAAFIMSPEVVKSHPDDWLSSGNEAGSGPYMIEKQVMGKQVILTKFEDYWGGWDEPHFDKVVYNEVGETATRRQLIEKGDADIVIELTNEDVEALKSNPNVKVLTHSSFENLSFMLNTQKGPLKDKLIRQAISYAFPYDDVVKYAIGGYGTQARGVVPVGLWGHGDDLFQYTYDLDKARELLKQAGYPNGGFKLSMTYLSGHEYEKKSAELFQAELAKLNIELEVRAMPWAAACEEARNKDINKRQDIFTMIWYPDLTGPYTFLQIYASESEPLLNFTYQQNKIFDGLIEEANDLSGSDKNKSIEKFIEAQKILIDDDVAIFAFDNQYVRVINKSFKGYVDNPAYPGVVFFYDTYRAN